MSRKLHIEVFRYNPLDPASVPHMQSFYVEEYSSMTLFIALNIIREQQDPSLQFDFCCRAGICGSCGMVINGRPGLACHTQTRDLPDHIVLHPLPVFKLLGDLSVDTGVWFREVGRKIEAWVHTQDKAFDPRAEEKRMENELAEQIFELDRCIECGFCEVNCLSCGFTLSSRQRIVLQREIARLRQSGEAPERLALLEKQYRYPGNQTCAGDGLCSMSCPMGINTGDLTHIIRQKELPQGSMGYKAGNFAANHFAGIKSALRPVLGLANLGHSVLGTKAMSCITKGMHNVLGIPLWTPAMPKAYSIKSSQLTIDNDTLRNKNADKDSLANGQLKVVYFPSCINQTMGLPKKSPVEQALASKMIALLQKGGYEVIFPENMEKLCCGTIWESKGMLDIADRKSAELEAALWKASEQGRYPVLCDQSPCLHRMRETIHKMKLYEPAEFIYTFLRNRLVFTPTDRPVAVHITCSMRKMGLAGTITALARLCSSKVIVPEEVGCCGFAGDRGFTYPELNAYALRKLRPQIEAAGVSIGYSNSRTCEIGLTTNSGIPYVSIVYLVDECTQPATVKLNN